ncbi:MAG: hypothetical protein FJ297_14890 [Planctomycetes bacterium]|nr:hypothetical protein [Planctomycetota bacterium]
MTNGNRLFFAIALVLGGWAALDMGRGVRGSSLLAWFVERPSADDYATNWPRFRGPDGSGICRHARIPEQWDGTTGTGIRWKIECPLPGANSPVVWGDRVFLSGATRERREVFCFSAATGALQWRAEVCRGEVPGDASLKVNRDTGYAAPTLATDGRLVFALFANGSVGAVDFSGREVWSRSLGIPKNPYGHAASLVTHGSDLIIQWDHGSAEDGLSKLISLNGSTGEPNWRATRPVPTSWCTPIIARASGRLLLITGGDPWVIAYDPATGEERWRADCLAPAEIGTSPVFSDGHVFAANHYAQLSAIRVDGMGDVTATHIAWTADEGLPDICSPLVTDRHVLLLDSGGTLTCYDKRSGGKPLWQEEFETEFASSPSLVGNRVYLIDRQGTTWIVEPTNEGCRRVAKSRLGEPCVTSPAFQDGRIFVRGENHLFCIGTTE